MKIQKEYDGFAVCLSHDVDRISKTFQFVTHFLKAVADRKRDSALYQLMSVLLKKHYWCFDQIMDIENRYNVKSTFFFLNETLPFRPFSPSNWKVSLGYYNIFERRVKEIINILDTQGWEVGVHGSYNSYNNIGLLIKEKSEIEQILGHEVRGIRQHFLNLSDQTWKIQREAGFSYDASYGFTDKIGFRDNRYDIFSLDQHKDFHIVPLAVMDTCLMKQTDPLNSAIELIRLARRKNACLVLNWHQRVFNEREFPGYSKMYMRTIEECLRRGGRFSTIGEYVNDNQSQ